MGLISLTALWALEDTAQLKSGETILLQGGAGGMAGFAIQLARHIGATVITTASAENHAYVRHLGADQVIDYHTEDFTRVADPCDVVFDTIGRDVQVRSYDVLKGGGRLVWIAAAPAGFVPSRQDVQVLRPAVERDRAHLERMAELLASGAVWPPEITRYKLADAAEAHSVSEGRHLRGKLVLEVCSVRTADGGTLIPGPPAKSWAMATRAGNVAATHSLAWPMSQAHRMNQRPSSSPMPE